MALESPSSSFSYRFTYDVFLSFRGSDTRFGFTGNLYKALCDSGIRTFMDDRELQGGDEITPSLVKAIEESRIFIPVFSINYAVSSFCLDELVRIIHCFNTKGSLVLPVFYGVDPSHVRHQNESYGEALTKHKKRFQNNKKNYKKYYTDNMERLREWKMALNQAANLSGHHFNPGNGYEYEFIGKIVKYVSNKINRAPLHVADYPVGLQSQVQQVISLLDVGSDDRVCMVGIHGTGGMGKTALARATYNFVADQFECLCFLHNVRENSAQKGLKHLQQKILSNTVGFDIKLEDVSEGIPIIKQRLHRKKVLLILDDVDKSKQLQVLAGGLDWFGVGSKVIITTRDKHLLASHRIERAYEVHGLNGTEALELLRWMAFKNDTVDSSYRDILNRALTYASGLPLALEVVGSNLSGKKRIEEWKSLLDEYERIPNKEIQEILRVSFDDLGEKEKSVFLDIACCFKGYKLAEVQGILCAHHGQCMKYHIGVLVEKSLIKVSRWGLHEIVTLHDLIEDMGKEIVRQESPKLPGKRSRLWFHEDIIHILEENKGTSHIETIHMNFPLSEEDQEVVEWKGDELMKMENLKTLIIKNGHFSKGPQHLPNSLRVLEWPRYSSRDMPSNFCPKKLSICKLPENGFTSFELCGSLKRFANMRELNLDGCQHLTQILDVSGLPYLEIFSFQNCKNLITIHNSVGFLNKLKILDAEGCSKLVRFPPIKLTSLQELRLSDCKSLKCFPEILGKMENITLIELLGTSIEELPFSIQNLTGLRRLDIWGNGMLRLPSSILMMPNLSWIDAPGRRLLLPKQNNKPTSMVPSNVEFLNLQKSNLSDEFLPIVLTWFSNVQYLDLWGNNFTILPKCIKECRFLSELRLDYCKCLREIRGIPPNLKILSAECCESLTTSCRSMLLNQELHEAGDTQFRLAGTERIPEWIERQSRGPSISFWFRNNLSSVALFVATKSIHPNSGLFHLKVCLNINSYKYPIDSRHLRPCLKIRPDHTYLFDFDLQLQSWALAWKHKYTSEEFQILKSKLDEALLKNEWIHAEVTCESWKKRSLLTEIGIHVFKQKSSMEDIQFTNPYKKKRKLDGGCDDDDDDDDDHYSH